MNNEESDKKIKELLKQAISPAEHAELQRDLWPQMLPQTRRAASCYRRCSLVRLGARCDFKRHPRFLSRFHPGVALSLVKLEAL